MSGIKAATFKLGGILASLALIFGIASTQAVCMSWYHQPKVPQGMEKYKKFSYVRK